MQEKRKNTSIKDAHEDMEAYLRENVPTINDCYIGPLCNKPIDVFYLRDNVIEGQMLMVQSLNPYCAIWLGREKGHVN